MWWLVSCRYIFVVWTFVIFDRLNFEANKYMDVNKCFACLLALLWIKRGHIPPKINLRKIEVLVAIHLQSPGWQSTPHGTICLILVLCHPRVKRGVVHDAECPYWDQAQLSIQLNSAKKLTLKVLNFWKFTRCCSLKPLWSGMREVVLARTSPTLHSPSPLTVHQLSQLAL